MVVDVDLEDVRVEFDLERSVKLRPLLAGAVEREAGAVEREAGAVVRDAGAVVRDAGAVVRDEVVGAERELELRVTGAVRTGVLRVDEVDGR